MADNKVSALTELVTPARGDLLYAVDDPLGTPLSRNAKIENILRGRDVVVAASDSLADWQKLADYICDGANDDVQIQAAVGALGATGGRVLLSPGTFSVGATVTLGKNVVLQGQGWSWGSGGTILEQAHNGDVIYYDPGAPASVVAVTVRDLFVRGDKITYANGVGIHFGPNCMDTRILRVGSTLMPSHGFQAEQGWGLIVDDLVSEYNGGDGVHITGGTQPNILQCKLLENDGWGLYTTCGLSLILNSTIRGDLGALYVGGADSIIVGNILNTAGAVNQVVHITKANVILTGNKIYGDGTQAYGVYLQENNITVKNNYITGYTTAPINVATGVRRDAGVCQVEHFQDCLAASANHVVNGQDLSLASPITCAIAASPDVPRTVSWALTHGNITEFTLTIDGYSADGYLGSIVRTTITEADGWSGETSIPYARVAQVRFTREAGTGVGDTLNIGIADKLGLTNRLNVVGDVYKVKENQADYTNYTVNATYKTVSINGGIGAGNDYTIWYRSLENVIS